MQNKIIKYQYKYKFKYKYEALQVQGWIKHLVSQSQHVCLVLSAIDHRTHQGQAAQVGWLLTFKLLRIHIPLVIHEVGNCTGHFGSRCCWNLFLLLWFTAPLSGVLVLILGPSESHAVCEPVCDNDNWGDATMTSTNNTTMIYIYIIYIYYIFIYI